mmetsp:Transcript_4260/g.11016  ORF Transcript_4260/g.11016 Transcript_4260/m.11016 type:complete len:192 (+) Transcript_4260:283-858(+)
MSQRRTRSSGKLAFLTVGTTKFDKLVKAIDDKLVLKTLVESGYTRLTLQIGHGDYLPRCIVPGDGEVEAVHCMGQKRIRVDYFRLSPSLADIMAEADLVISHAGAGSIFEALNAGKKVVAVPNPDLMVNHQEELAVHLSDAGFLRHSNLDGIAEAIATVESEDLKTYVPHDASQIANAIDQIVMGGFGKHY